MPEGDTLHHENLRAAIRDGAALNCPADLGFRGLVPVWMANESWFTRKMLRWDDAARQAVPV